MSLDLASLERARTVAREVALEAGSLLRDEAYRLDGPRGEGAHAVVDREVELRIRKQLTESFPTWSYLGEETGRAGDSPTCWVVDPNDGTSLFLAGNRMHSVSIGLVHEGVPVLGVVHAPRYPDDDGDTFSAVQGGTLERNGYVLQRTVDAAELDPLDIVALSHPADRVSLANAQAVFPARYRSVGSIAYRLALAASGEVSAAAGLAGPQPWDLAGAMALLHTAQLSLVDGAGNVLHTLPQNQTPRVFAGSHSLATSLANRDWRAVIHHGNESTTPAWLATLPRTRRRVSSGVLSRAQGALLGQCMGDAFGAQVEFMRPEAIQQLFPHGVRELRPSQVWKTLAGQITDDSELALSLARSLVQCQRFDLAHVQNAYRAWLDSQPFDVGYTTRRGLRGNPNHESLANGALMRVSPLGVFGHAMPSQTLSQLAAQDAALTHPHVLCAQVSSVFACTVAFAVREGPSARDVFDFALREAARTSSVVHDVLRAASNGPPDDYLTHEGYVLIALQNAFFQLAHAPSFEHALIDTVARGGDTDTNAAIAGALFGAVAGRSNIPSRWTRTVLSCRPIEGLANVHRPRPAVFWPVDLLELAECLLLAGDSST